MQNLKFHSNRLDAAPTEVQMKPAIAQAHLNISKSELN